MRRVILESPYRGAEGTHYANLKRNIAYARAAMHDCLLRNDSPFPSHLLFTQPGVLDDKVPGERELGIEAGLAWGPVAAATVVYADLSITPGMQRGIDRAHAEGRPVEVRFLGGDWTHAGDAL